MKLQHFCIIFLIIILPFSIMARNTTREYMLTLRDQTRLNNVIDNATQDALDMIVELNDEFQSMYFAQQFNVTQSVAKEAVKSFFQTLAINYNMPYIEGDTEAYFSTYVPAIVIIGYDGFYVYSINEVGGAYAYQMSPKIPYSYEEDDMIINFTLGNDLKILYNGVYYEGTLTDNYTTETHTKVHGTGGYVEAFGGVITELVNYLPDITDDMSVILYTLDYYGPAHLDIPDFLFANPGETPLLQDYSRASGDASASIFHQTRRNVIMTTIREVLQDEINSHTSYASLMGSTYDFRVPEISNDDWTNSINDISVMTFIQGLPIGINKYYNNYALGGAKIVNASYLYGYNSGGAAKYYHDEDCEDVRALFALDMDDPANAAEVNKWTIFLNRVEAATQGYFPCNKCKP